MGGVAIPRQSAAFEPKTPKIVMILQPSSSTLCSLRFALCPLPSVVSPSTQSLHRHAVRRKRVYSPPQTDKTTLVDITTY
jgi:hypothetical protein